MSNQSGNVILGTLIGAALGVAAGILLAPAKGDETREVLAGKANDAKLSIDELATSALNALKRIKDSAENSFKSTVNVVENQSSKVASEAKQKLG